MGSPALRCVQHLQGGLRLCRDTGYGEPGGGSLHPGGAPIEDIACVHASRVDLAIAAHAPRTCSPWGACAGRGAGVRWAGRRYQRNDSALIMENVVVDLGAYIRHAKEVWKYEKVVLV